MLIKSSTEESSCTVGTQHARRLSGRHRIRKTVPPEARNSAILAPTSSVIVSHFHRAVFARPSFLVQFDRGPDTPDCCGVVVVKTGWIDPCEGLLVLVEISRGCKGSVICSVFVPVAVFTVRALYAGTLVTCWTTALCPRCRCSSALLAALCLTLATLTITARCYASSNATHPLVQFTPHSPRSPINSDSSTLLQHSSRIVLSRLFNSPRKVVQSDTRIIVTNSKILLYNQTFKIFNRRNFNAHFRTKRELQTNPVFLNDFQSYQTKTYSEENSSLYNNIQDTQPRNNAIPSYSPSTSDRSRYSSSGEPSKYPQALFVPSVRTAELKAAREQSHRQAEKDLEGTQVLNLDKRSDFVVNGTNGSEGVWNTSANANFSEVSSTLRVVDHQNDQEDKQRPLPESRVPQPMPPAHGHNNNSCKFFYPSSRFLAV